MTDQVLWEQICSNQNLKLAWNRVKENKGSPGVDSITLEEFEKNLDNNLNLLQKELENGDFKPLPVLRIYLDKEDGTRRPIGIPPVRDRVVQQVLHSVLSPIFEEEFLDCSFAYRPGRSALEAIDKVEALINKGNKWVLDGDIKKFFDSIDHDLLLSLVAGRVSDDSVLRLIRKFLKTGFFDNMSIHEEYFGITQGSAISPLLANIYLHNFDVEINVRGYHLIRYADDFLILEDSQERTGKALADTAVILRELKLDLNENKTKIIPVAEGFVFLGYYIDDKGKGPGKKAINAINRKLKEINQANKNRNFGESIEDLKESIRRWSSYFHTCRGIELQNPLILIALIEMSIKLGDEEYAGKLLEKRKDLTIDQADIYFRLGHVAQTLGLREAALDNFSQALALDADHFQAKESLKQLQLVDEDIYASIERLKKLIHFCPDLAQPYRDLAYCYAELGEYGQARESYQQALKFEIEAIPEEKPITPPQSVEVPQLIFSDEDVLIFSSLFKGKAGFFARQWVNEIGRRGFAPVSHSLNTEDIKHHFSGNETLGLYLLNAENQVFLAVIDIDIDKKALLEYANNEEETGRLHNLTHQDAVEIAGVCDDLDIPVVIEDSGYKGRHLWFFFGDPIPAKLARIFLKFITEKAGKPSGGIHWEIFPNLDKVRGKGFGPLIKLPLGIHKRTNRRCHLLDREGTPLPDQMVVLSQIKHITRQRLEELLLTYTVKPKASPLTDKKEESPLVENLLSGCNVINYLVNKARDTHYLNNSERITLLYTLGHLGQEGKDFLHKVISNCINYDYDYTEKQIRKMKSSPISCPKIKEKHEDFALDLGCNCNFRIPYKGYPSPVLHAFKQPKTWPFQSPPLNEKSTITQDNITIPESISGDLKKYIELKKQLGGVEKSIHRIEEEMSSYFDKAGTESIITEYGLLERKRKAGNKFEWTIKL
ncbi:MAG: group II intron reverse transcriptase/maturase [Methanosarcinales archaeon]|nr:group II intron reverse transcriptase/maturase [Methanosarcinales archaeon]